jgi:ubiquinone/menaquinone biosynthesis C-methylase UbiE
MIRPEEATSNNVYDKCAKSYGYDIDSALSSRLKYHLLNKYIDSNHTVLDVGCGNGIYIQAVAHYCTRIIGIDINDNMLFLAREKLREKGITNAQLYKQSASSVQFEDNSFDLVYSFSTLLLIPDFFLAIRQILRVLKPGGIAILDITGRYNLSQIYWSRYYRSHGHFGVNSFSHKTITELLLQLNTEVIEEHALGFTDQWKYLPLLNHITILDRLFHKGNSLDLDYLISNIRLFFPLANRWYIVGRKTASL